MTEHNDAPKLDRRSVVKTAAHLAWAVPAVQLAAAAPALAVSGTPTAAAFNVSGTATYGTGPNSNKVTGTFTVANTGQTAGTATLTVVITGTAGAKTANWSGTFPTYTSPSIAGGSSAVFTISWTYSGNKTGRGITVTATPGGTDPSEFVSLA